MALASINNGISARELLEILGLGYSVYSRLFGSIATRPTAAPKSAGSAHPRPSFGHAQGFA